VELDGTPLGTIPHRRRARLLAYLPQQVTPLYDLSVAELVESGRYPWSGPWRGADSGGDHAVRRALDATDTAHLARRDFGSLSGGERQRCLVAAVLAQEPQWLLLDEPTASLDLHHAVGVFRVLRRTAREGRGVLAVTHDLNLAGLFADRIVLLAGGRKLAEGPVDRVLCREVLAPAYGELVVVRHPGTGRPAVLPGPAEGS
jgi:iron complex transport system ATP-binding protein